MSLEIDTSRRGTLCLSEIINVVLYFCLFFFIPSVFAYFNPLIITCSKAKVIWRASRTQEITSFPVAPQSFLSHYLRMSRRAASSGPGEFERFNI